MMPNLAGSLPHHSFDTQRLVCTFLVVLFAIAVSIAVCAALYGALNLAISFDAYQWQTSSISQPIIGQ